VVAFKRVQLRSQRHEHFPAQARLVFDQIEEIGRDSASKWQALVARTVAVRGCGATKAISPKWLPLSRLARRTPSFSTSAVP